MADDDSTEVTVTRGMLRRWAETLDEQDMASMAVDHPAGVVAEAIRAVLDAARVSNLLPLTPRDGLNAGDRVVHIARGRTGTLRSAMALDMGGDHQWNVLLDGAEQPNRVSAKAGELAWGPSDDGDTDVSPDPEGAEATVIAPSSDTARKAES